MMRGGFRRAHGGLNIIVTPPPPPSLVGFDKFRIMAFGQNPVLPNLDPGTYGGEAWAAIDQDNNHFATLKSWGIDTIAGYDGQYGTDLDTNGFVIPDVKQWDAAAAAAGLSIIRRPICQFTAANGFDGRHYTQADMGYDAALSHLIAWGLQDEPNSGTRFGQDLFNFVWAQILEIINSGYLGAKLLTQNLVGSQINGFINTTVGGDGINGLKLILALPQIKVWLADNYPDINGYPMLFSSYNSGGFYKTTTEQGAELHNFIRGYWDGSKFVPAGSAGKPAVTHIWAGRGNSIYDGRPTNVSTPSTFGVQYGSNIINGGASVGLFLAGFDANGAFRTQCYTQQLPDVLRALKDHIANTRMLMNAVEGDVLMLNQNRRPYTLLEGRNVTSDPNVFTSRTLGSTPVNGLPDPFEGTDIDMGGGVHYRVVHSQHPTDSIPLSLSGHPVWGTVNLGTFVPGQWKAFKSTAPTTDLCTWTPAPSPTPTPSYTYPSGYTAPTALPTATGSTSTVSSMAALATAIASASAGDTIKLAAGAYTFASGAATLALSNINKGTGTPVFIIPADAANPPVIKGSYNGGTNKPALVLDNCQGIAFNGIKFAFDDIPTGAPGFYNISAIVQFTTPGSRNIWIVGGEMKGTFVDSKSWCQAILGPSASDASTLITDLHILGVTFTDCYRAMVLTNITNLEIAFTKGTRLSEDYTDLVGCQNFKFYFNTATFLSEPTSHPDFFQFDGGKFETPYTRPGGYWRAMTGGRIFGNSIPCNVEAGNQGRCQGITFASSTLRGEPTYSGLSGTSPGVYPCSDIRIGQNLLMGTLDFGITFMDDPGTNIVIEDNEIYHLDNGDGVNGTYLRVNGTGFRDRNNIVYAGSYTPLSGSITGNVGGLDTSNAVNMTGQITQVASTSLANTTARDNKQATWLARRAGYAALIGVS